MSRQAILVQVQSNGQLLFTPILRELSINVYLGFQLTVLGRNLLIFWLSQKQSSQTIEYLMPDRGLYKLEHRIDICPADVVVEAFSQGGVYMLENEFPKKIRIYGLVSDHCVGEEAMA